MAQHYGEQEVINRIRKLESDKRELRSLLTRALDTMHDVMFSENQDEALTNLEMEYDYIEALAEEIEE